MQITIQAIISNLLTAQSEEIMHCHLSDERFLSVWNTYMVCRFLSFSPLGIGLLPVLNEIASVKDPKLVYPMLLTICKGLKSRGEHNEASTYKPSPFTE